MADLKPNGQRAKIAILLIWIVLAMESLSLVSSYLQYQLLQAAASGVEITPEEAEANDLRELLCAAFFIIAYIVSIVTFIQWFRRAYFNLHQKVSYLGFSEGWAAGSWFVPFINLVRPYKIMKELYQETKAYLTDKGVNVDETLTTTILGWWWALWLVNGFVGNLVFRISLNAETIDELISATITGMVGHLVGIMLSLITLKVVKDYANVEPILYDVKDDGLQKYN